MSERVIVGSVEQTVGALVRAVAESQNQILDLTSNWHSAPFGTQTDTEGGVQIEERGEAVVVHLNAVMQVGVDNPAMTGTQFEFRVSAAVAEAGWRVSSLIEARLGVALEGHPPGRYVMHEKGSPVLKFEAAMDEFRTRVAALDGYADALDTFGLVRAG